MTPFAYAPVRDVNAALAQAGQAANGAFIAGGTDLIQLMQERVAEPDTLLFIGNLPLRRIAADHEGLHIGALARLADVADDALVREEAPLVVQALLETASPQVRRMATIGGNLLQRTRCLYFRDATTPCNKRQPGSGCAALGGQNRLNAVLGGSDHCTAAHPSDLATALTALDASVVLEGAGGDRSVPIADFYRLPGDRPDRETVLKPGELITEVKIPTAPAGRRSCFLKVRDRASFEWALAACAVALDLEDGVVAGARVVAGGVATVPWRLEQVERVIVGRAPDRAAAEAAGALAAEGAVGHGHDDFKIPLIRNTVTRALLQVGGVA